MYSKLQLTSCLFLIAVLLGCGRETVKDHFVRVEGTRFVINGEPYYFVGTNFWYGAYLGSPGETGDRERLVRELDLLVEIGVNNLRVSASSEAAAHERSLRPAFQSAPGEVNEDLLAGLDFLFAEMGKRNMKAVVFLNNFWEWSGGMSAYSEWFGEGPVIDPLGGDWHGFMNHSARFYFNDAAQEAFRSYIKGIITRKNSITGLHYNEDPTIMSWQLANEPRAGSGQEGIDNAPRFIEWVHETSAFIKELAPRQLVSTGNEGTHGSMDSEKIYLDAHSSPYVDYATFHMWAKNWGWFDADNMEGTFPSSKENAKAYIDKHYELALKLGKPTVLSEFGLGRDFESFDPDSQVTYRDMYFEFVFSLVEEGIRQGYPIAGTNLWSWGGYGEALHADYIWREGDPFTGDPPQEPQGLNSIFAQDLSTLRVIRNHAENLSLFSGRTLATNE